MNDIMRLATGLGNLAICTTHIRSLNIWPIKERSVQMSPLRGAGMPLQHFWELGAGMRTANLFQRSLSALFNSAAQQHPDQVMLHNKGLGSARHISLLLCQVFGLLFVQGKVLHLLNDTIGGPSASIPKGCINDSTGMPGLVRFRKEQPAPSELFWQIAANRVYFSLFAEKNKESWGNPLKVPFFNVIIKLSPTHLNFISPISCGVL